jgi:hypothetical protein
MRSGSDFFGLSRRRHYPHSTRACNIRLGMSKDMLFGNEKIWFYWVFGSKRQMSLMTSVAPV